MFGAVILGAIGLLATVVGIPLIVFLITWTIRVSKSFKHVPGSELRNITAVILAVISGLLGVVVAHVAATLMARAVTGTDVINPSNTEATWLYLLGMPVGLALYLLADRYLTETVWVNHLTPADIEARKRTSDAHLETGPITRALLGVSAIIAVLTTAWVGIEGTRAITSAVPKVATALAVIITLADMLLLRSTVRNVNTRPALLAYNAEGDTATRRQSFTRLVIISEIALFLVAIQALAVSAAAGRVNNGNATFTLILVTAALSLAATTIIWVEQRKLSGGHISPAPDQQRQPQTQLEERQMRSERSALALVFRAHNAGYATGFDYTADPYDDEDRADQKQNNKTSSNAENS